MKIDRLRELLDQPARAESWLATWGLDDVPRGHANLLAIAQSGVTLDLLAVMCHTLAEHLPRSSDPDMALNNLERFVAAARSPLALASLFERDPDALPILLQIFSTSQHFSDVLVQDPAGYDLLRITEGQPVAREVLVEELAAEIAALDDEAAVLAALRRFKRRETLRIAYGDFIRGQRLETVTSQISFLADAIVEGAIRFARRRLIAKRGTPRGCDGAPARFVALAMGKWGGAELNYSSDIDVIFIYDQDGETDGPRRQSNLEFFDRLALDVVKLLTERTDMGVAYRVDLRLRPEGERGPVVHGLDRATHYYDVLGRTWERQAYVKARPAAGDLEFGHEFLGRLEPWIYRRYLGLADITGIKALKRRIERRAERDGEDALNVKTGRGGIRDIEFAIQFLQLLNGGDLPATRVGNTLEAIARLEQVGCLTHQERSILAENYAFLRNIEHRLQVMFDLQTHVLPAAAEEQRKLAIRMGYSAAPRGEALREFEADYRAKTDVNRRILDHLLHDAFRDDAATEPEVDLILDPDPPQARVHEVLSRYPFRDATLAYKNLMALATERIRFLSTRRCRHFLASIAPALLKRIALTPDPDSTLSNLEKVSDSLGGKGVLWELFSFNPPSLDLYVELCSTSPFLSGLLIGNPGMIDELMDSLVLNKLPTRAALRETLAELAKGAEDLDPILHGFKNTQELRVGTRDILGKEDIQETLAALSSIAETCLERIALVEFEKLADKLGSPTLAEGDSAGEPCGWVILALGKLGGRELDYRSDLDLIFLYEADGPTRARRARSSESTTNQHFFSELGQRIIKITARLGPYGRLYEVDPRLRPTGKSGALATTYSEFARYYASGQGRLWERQALLKGRVVASDSPASARRAMEVVERAAFEHEWSPDQAVAIREMRARMEEGAGRWNLKRGPGGMVDVEFLAQMSQLRYAADQPRLRTPNTLEALAALRAQGHIAAKDADFLDESYRFLRAIKSRLRLMDNANRNDLSLDPIELAKLAKAMAYADGASLLAALDQRTRGIRERFDRIFAEAAAATSGRVLA